MTGNSHKISLNVLGRTVEPSSQGPKKEPDHSQSSSLRCRSVPREHVYVAREHRMKTQEGDGDGGRDITWPRSRRRDNKYKLEPHERVECTKPKNLVPLLAAGVILEGQPLTDEPKQRSGL